MSKLLAAYSSVSGSNLGIGRGNETTAAPSSELLNFILRNYSAFCTLINVFLLLKGKATVTPSAGLLFLKPLQIKTKLKGGGGTTHTMKWKGLL